MFFFPATPAAKETLYMFNRQNTTSRLEDKIRYQRQTIKRKNNEIKRLKDAMQVLLAHSENDPEKSDTEHDASRSPTLSDEDDDEDMESVKIEEEDDLHDPIFDGFSTYYCTACAYEVVDGECCDLDCGLMHHWTLEMVKNVSDRGCSTNTQAINEDRSLIPRGSTPFEEHIDDADPPEEYCASQTPIRRKSRFKEYVELLKRGATRLMCEEFHLEFSYDSGIYAWADHELFEQFSGKQMRAGDFWKIHLGRRVDLDDDDKDGSAFIEGLLEDVLLFSYRTPWNQLDYQSWETVEETSGIWVTRMTARKDTDDASDNSDDMEVDADAEEKDKDKNKVTSKEETKNGDNADDGEGEPEPERPDEPSWDSMYDLALETSLEDNGPIRIDAYTFSDDDSEDEDEMQDLGISWHAASPDRVWADEDEKDELEDEKKDEQEGGEEDKLEEGEEDESSCESDFDEDEILSGDEAVLQRRGWGHRVGFKNTTAFITQ